MERAIAFERAAIALVGEHRRRAYAHDLVYGMHKLYNLYGKPWNGSTEGADTLGFRYKVSGGGVNARPSLNHAEPPGRSRLCGQLAAGESAVGAREATKH